MYRDAVDWVGGWPFEVASPAEVVEFCRARGFRLARIRTVGRRHGCNEFVFRRADPDDLATAVYHSLDRKVCNTVNTVCVPADRAHDLVPAFLDALDRAGRRRGAVAKLHVVTGQEHHVPASWFEEAPISRAGGIVTETGCMLSHGAVVAREYGLPMITAVPGIMSALSSGDIVELDGRRGTLTVIERTAGN